MPRAGRATQFERFVQAPNTAECRFPHTPRGSWSVPDCRANDLIPIDEPRNAEPPSIVEVEVPHVVDPEQTNPAGSCYSDSICSDGHARADGTDPEPCDRTVDGHDDQYQSKGLEWRYHRLARRSNNNDCDENAYEDHACGDSALVERRADMDVTNHAET